MSVSMANIPSVETAGRLGRRLHPETTVADAYLSSSQGENSLGSLIGTIGSAGLALGMDFVSLLQRQVFPSGPQLSSLQAAAAPSYTTYFDCTVYDYNGTCDEACFGFAPHHMDPYYCATCAEQAADPNNNPPTFWHFVGSRGQIQYKDMEANACNGKDAWKWKVGACGNCHESAVFRCHDGYKKYPDDNTWDPTICQGLVACDGRLSQC